MSVLISLTEAQLPPSEQFLEFLVSWITAREFDSSNWATFGEERPEPIGRPMSLGASQELWRRVAGSDVGVRHLGRAYELFVALLIGDVDAIRAVQQRFCFFLVIGAPRSGGKYLTKELFRALGHVPSRIPAVLAHDGFPEAGPWRFSKAGTTWIESLHGMAEYLAMVEIFFAEAGRHRGRVIVAKKATKAVHAPGLFQSVLGEDAEGVVTVRHPVPACISTYEASGGLPVGERFAQRGNIEKLWARDLLAAGWSEGDIAKMDYFDAYLRYWEDYHLRLAMGGSNLSRNYRIVAYGAERFMSEARRNAEHFGASTFDAESFHVFDRRQRHPRWIARAEPSIRRVSEQWARVGMTFPREEIAECW
ncbi:MAG: hypothetical protein ABWZ57_20400 [Mesorhizobium sp.]